MISTDSFEVKLKRREGTSCGLIAGFFYLFPSPLNFLSLFALLVIIFKITRKFVNRINKDLTLIGFGIFIYLLLDLFSNPTGLLLILDSMTITFAIVLFFSYFCKNEGKVY